MEFNQNKQFKIKDLTYYFLDELIIRNYSNTTINIYENIMEDFLSYINSKNINYIQDISIKHITFFRIFLKNTLDKGQTVIDRAISCLKTFYKVLTEMNIISSNIMENLNHKRKANKNIPKNIDIKETEEIIETIDSSENNKLNDSKVIFTLISQTGSKRSTLLNLKWDDIDFYKETITLDKNNPRKTRTLKMSKKLVNTLKKYNEVKQPYLNDYILSKSNKKLSNYSFTNIFNLIIKKLEETKSNIIKNSNLNETQKNSLFIKEKITPYIIRNSFINLLIDNNLDTPLIKNAVGLIDYKSVKKYK